MWANMLEKELKLKARWMINRNHLLKETCRKERSRKGRAAETR